MENIILASASPRRQDILRRMGLKFTVSPQDVDESFTGISADEEAVRLAAKKVQACMDTCGNGKWILGADTFIVHNGSFMGKAGTTEEARDMLKSLSDKTHEVITGLALNVPGTKSSIISTAFCRTLVTFASLSDDEIDWYISTGEWQGAAAAYRIQERGEVFIKSVTGSYSNVMGLPINTFYGMLRSNNYIFRT